MFPALQKDIGKLEDKSELCFCDKFDSDVFGLLKPGNPMIEVQFYLGNLSLNGTYLYTAPDKNGTLALLSDIPTSFSDAEFFLYNSIDATKQAYFDVSLLTTNTSQLFSFPDQSGILALLGDIPTSFSDADFFLYNDIDNSKQAHFDVSLLSGTTNQTYSFPNLNGTFALTTGVQSLSDKTLTSATITSNTNVVHASHLRTLTTPVDVSLATAPTPGQVLTYIGGIGDWQTPLDPVTTGNFTTTNITGFGGPWTIVPTSVLVEWSIISTTTLVANMRWVGGEFGGVGNYGITFPVPWQMSPETFGTINILDINAPNELDVPWYINPSSPGLMSTTGTVTLLAAKNATGFGNFQGIITAFLP